MAHNATEVIELMKVIHCLSLDDFFEMMGRPRDYDPGEYMYGKFKDMKHDMFEWLCQLDSTNQRLVFEYAEKKRIWFELRK